MRDLHPQHGARRRWWWPFGVVCRCGWPDPADCVIERAINAPAAQHWDMSQEYARAWRQAERRRWRGAR